MAKVDGTSGIGIRDPPALTTALLNGDLTPLRSFRVQIVHMELPWRNMANPTSFTLYYMSMDGFSVAQLVDFFEGAP